MVLVILGDPGADSPHYIPMGLQWWMFACPIHMPPSPVLAPPLFRKSRCTSLSHKSRCAVSCLTERRNQDWTICPWTIRGGKFWEAQYEYFSLRLRHSWPWKKTPRQLVQIFRLQNPWNLRFCEHCMSFERAFATPSVNLRPLYTVYSLLCGVGPKKNVWVEQVARIFHVPYFLPRSLFTDFLHNNGTTKFWKAIVCFTCELHAFSQNTCKYTWVPF